MEDISRKIRDGTYSTVSKESAITLLKYFVCVAATVDDEVTKNPYVSCIRCNTVLTSYIIIVRLVEPRTFRRHVDSCGVGPTAPPTAWKLKFCSLKPASVGSWNVE